MMNCDPKAFAKCPTRHLCGTPEDATFANGSECDKFNQQILHQPMTNADRIRAMSDEELIRLLCGGHGGFDCSTCKIGDQRKCDMECEKHCKTWLQQSAEREV